MLIIINIIVCLGGRDKQTSTEFKAKANHRFSSRPVRSTKQRDPVSKTNNHKKS